MTEAGASIGEVGAGFTRLAWRALALFLAALVVLEVALRARGLEPQNLYQVGFSATVIDRWTEWAMRPDVHLNEYLVTNAYGLHEDREVNLQKMPGVPRVAVIGSSVTWGWHEPLENTIPRSAQRTLEKAGCAAEVLNFGNQGFNILNASAYLQAKVHQFDPDAVVVIMDLQMGIPRFPRPNPLADEQAVVRRLGLREKLWKRATEYSVVLRALDDITWSRSLFAGRLPFPVEPKKAADARDSDARPVDAGRVSAEIRARQPLGRDDVGRPRQARGARATTQHPDGVADLGAVLAQYWCVGVYVVRLERDVLDMFSEDVREAFVVVDEVVLVTEDPRVARDERA